MVLLGSVRFFALQSVKARIPMIKFRKGAPGPHEHNTSSDAKTQRQAHPVQVSTNKF